MSVLTSLGPARPRARVDVASWDLVKHGLSLTGFRPGTKTCKGETTKTPADASGWWSSLSVVNDDKHVLATLDKGNSTAIIDDA